MPLERADALVSRGSTNKGGCDMPPFRLVSQKHLQAIGAVVVHWSLLEQVVEECLLGAAHIDQNPGARALTVHMSIEQRLDALLTAVDALLIDERFKEELAQIDRAIHTSRERREAVAKNRAK